MPLTDEQAKEATDILRKLAKISPNGYDSCNYCGKRYDRDWDDGKHHSPDCLYLRVKLFVSKLGAQ